MRVGVSSLTLGGLLKHLALVEDLSFGERISGEGMGPEWEAYARHTGHADLLREAVDGRTGEDPDPGWRWPEG